MIYLYFTDINKEKKDPCWFWRAIRYIFAPSLTSWEGTKKNTVIYETKVKKSDGKKIEIKVDENGKLVEIKDD